MAVCAAVGVAGCTSVEGGGDAVTTGTVPSFAATQLVQPVAPAEPDLTMSVDGEPAQALDSLPSAPETPQPAFATYMCKGGEEFTVENRKASVVVASGGDSIELPAAPAGQTGRYAESAYALLLDGSEAMWMAGNKPPASCTRPQAMALNRLKRRRPSRVVCQKAAKSKRLNDFPGFDAVHKRR